MPIRFSFNYLRAAFKAGGNLGVKFSGFLAVYSAAAWVHALGVRDLRGTPAADADVPGSVLGGAAAGLLFGAPAGARAAAVGMFQGSALKFAAGEGDQRPRELGKHGRFFFFFFFCGFFFFFFLKPQSAAGE